MSLRLKDSYPTGTFSFLLPFLFCLFSFILKNLFLCLYKYKKEKENKMKQNKKEHKRIRRRGKKV
jgi:hypothetical protein